MNLTSIIVAIIAAFPPTLVALLSLRVAKANTLALVETKVAVKEVHKEINSRMTQLIKSSKAESKAEGREIGRKEK